MQVEIDQQHIFLEAIAQHAGDRDGHCRGAYTAARTDDGQGARLGVLGGRTGGHATQTAVPHLD
ncbi:MAG TPA: hypothetical protein VFS85_07255, partial [Dongiaceae bacterium]|nr:hypothetical protein [Dongiaceae bacterium]